MKMIISNLEFNYDTGCKILKLKHKECPIKDLEDIWDDIIPLTFKEIAEIRNSEQRRVAFLYYGLERLIEDVKPKLVSKQTIKKETTWVSQSGELVTKKFNDTYELYKVEGKKLSSDLENKWQKFNDFYFVKFKDTSTDRVYLLWVDAQSVYSTNNPGKWLSNGDDYSKLINAIEAIAWTIQTNIDKGNIEKIVRQGDCIMIKPKKNKTGITRHLTEKEYRKLIVAES